MGALLEFAQWHKPGKKYLLKLFITEQHKYVVESLYQICASGLDGHYDIEVIDINKRPEFAEDAKIVAIPTLIRYYPYPIKRIIGDLSDRERVLSYLKHTEENLLS